MPFRRTNVRGGASRSLVCFAERGCAARPRGCADRAFTDAGAATKSVDVRIRTVARIGVPLQAVHSSGHNIRVVHPGIFDLGQVPLRVLRKSPMAIFGPCRSMRGVRAGWRVFRSFPISAAILLAGGCTKAPPDPTSRAVFEARAVTQQQGQVAVRAALLADDESERYFGVSLAGHAGRMAQRQER